MSPVQLPESIPGIDEEHRILSGGLRFRTVEEPERAGQGDRIEEVRADANHHIDCAGLDQLFLISISAPRASAAEFAMTKPARP